MTLAGDQPVFRAQHPPYDFWRSGIITQAPVHIVGIDAAHHRFIGMKRDDLSVEDPFDAVAFFQSTLGLLRLKVIDANPCMGIENHEGLRLFEEMLKEKDQHAVLEDFGMIARVKGVSIIHRWIARLNGRPVPGALQCLIADQGRSQFSLMKIKQNAMSEQLAQRKLCNHGLFSHVPSGACSKWKLGCLERAMRFELTT